jgi:radical SAM superfamily enzyme YgiQ (UPF0313 family)
MVSEERIELLQSAGCVTIVFGLQSASERIRREICNRHYSNDEIESVVKLCKKYGIKVSLEIIFGLPYEEKSDYDQAVEFFRELKPDVISTYWLTYYPNTSIIQKGMDAGLLNEEDLEKINNGENSFFRRGNFIKNRKMLLRYQLLFDFIPLIPNKVHKWLTNSGLVWKIPPSGYFVHYFFYFLIGLKNGGLRTLRRVFIAFSRKNVP